MHKCKYKCKCCLQRMVRNRENIPWAAEVRGEWADWLEMMVTQITTRYNQGMQNTISEHTTHRTLKQMDSSSRRPHRVPLLSAKNRTRRIQFTQDHQNWTIEDWKNVTWSDESRFLLRHSDGRVRIWCKEHKSMGMYSIYIYGHSTTNTWPGFEESFCFLRATIVAFKLICVRMQAASGFSDFDYL